MRVWFAAVIGLLVAVSAACGREDAHPFQRGVCYASAWRNRGADGYGSGTSQQTLGRLRRLGVAIETALVPSGAPRWIRTTNWEAVKLLIDDKSEDEDNSLDA
jgi:hypothetical protein